MRRPLRPYVLAWLLAFAGCASTAPPAPVAGPSTFVGFISESDCGTDHAVMLATGKMGTTDAECALRCVRMGAVFGFVDLERKSFFQLDDQQKPRSFAGRRVRVTGHIQGDTLFVRTIEAADGP